MLGHPYGDETTGVVVPNFVEWPPGTVGDFEAVEDGPVRDCLHLYLRLTVGARSGEASDSGATSWDCRRTLKLPPRCCDYTNHPLDDDFRQLAGDFGWCSGWFELIRAQ